jgi:hypothetical protein
MSDSGASAVRKKGACSFVVVTQGNILVQVMTLGAAISDIGICARHHLRNNLVKERPIEHMNSFNLDLMFLIYVLFSSQTMWVY